MTAEQPIRSREGFVRKPGLGAASLSEHFIVRNMKGSSKASVTGVPKSDNPCSGKDYKMHLSNIGKRKAVQQASEGISAQRIQRAWLSHMDKTIFQLLKHTVCAAECCVTHEILKKVSPLEAELLKDPSMKCKGVADARKMMGEKKFYHQYSSLLDETPASSGGRNNYWRKLNLKNIPRTMIIYDIVDYAESGIISNRLQKEMKYLSRRPQTEEMPIKPLYRPYRQQNQMKHLGRRSKQAQMKVEKMKKAYKMAKEKTASMGMEPQTDTRGTKQRQTIIFSTPPFDIVKVDELMPDEELEKQEKELFAWYQDFRCHGPNGEHVAQRQLSPSVVKPEERLSPSSRGPGPRRREPEAACAHVEGACLLQPGMEES
ncbi:hypothetical protein GH733_019276 [Mirounga leonina]|nr:hypothetical protein GH733_019276 [Mirounga leonina]